MTGKYPLSPLRSIFGDDNRSDASLDSPLSPEFKTEGASPYRFLGLAGKGDFRRSASSLASSLAVEKAAEQTHRNSIFHWWWAEICACIVSMIAMVFLIIVLYVQDRKPIQTWEGGNITVNTVVAGISTICRISIMFPVSGAISQAMWIWFSNKKKNGSSNSQLGDVEIFDGASRGAWGSILLLWRLKAKLHLATIGAILTIASIAFDIFTQQVLGYATITLPGSPADFSTGSVPRLESFSDYSIGASLSDWVPTLAGKSAVRTGFFADSVSIPNIACSTGNCTWPVVPSLAVCGACTPTTYTNSCDTTVDNSKWHFCNYTMESGTTVSVSNQLASLNTVFFAEQTASGSIYNMSDPVTPYIAVMDTMYSSPDANIPSWTNVSAAECALWFCVQAYTTTTNDSTTSQIISEYSTILPVDNPALNFSATRQFVDVPASFNTLPNSTFEVADTSFFSFQSYIATQQMMNGTIMAGIGEQASSNDYMLQLWTESSDLDKWVKKLATVMTNYFRTYNSSVYTHNAANGTYNGTASANLYAGTAYIQVTHVRVRWGWLTFPLALTLLSIVFLILSIIQTRRSSIGAWKSSPLALLWTEVDEGIKAHAGREMNRAGGLENRIGKTKVVLRPEMGGGKWVLRAPKPTAAV